MTNSTLRLRRNLIATSCLVAAGALAPLAAHADDATAAAGPAAPANVTAASDAAAASASVAPIIVNAERREVNIQRAPISISSVAARQLDQSFVTDVKGLNGTIPSLEVTKASGFENLVTIRGVGSETPENSLTTVPGVSEFIDGVYIANTISLDQTLFDIDNIQVLRGPQGALYGQSSIGGAIIINTNQPRLNAYDGQRGLQRRHLQPAARARRGERPGRRRLGAAVLDPEVRPRGLHQRRWRSRASALTTSTTPAARSRCSGSRTTSSRPR